jgi:hypothetical protein
MIGFMIGAIGEWPLPSEYLMVECQENDVSGGVPAQQVLSGNREVEWRLDVTIIQMYTPLFF